MEVWGRGGVGVGGVGGGEGGETRDPASVFFKIRVHSSNYIYRIYI